MQFDFHYCGTYVLARLSGFGPGDSRRIATACQYVDAATEKAWTCAHPDGARFLIEPTGHGVGEPSCLNDRDDQIRIWVPFHFLPGNHGEVITSRLVCQPDSRMANLVFEHAIQQRARRFGMEALGIAAHAYADTFAHDGFCGVSSRLNAVVTDSIRLENGARHLDPVDVYGAQHDEAGRLPNFRSKNPFVSAAAQLGTGGLRGVLGHAAVATFPDAPFLRWTYCYQEEERWGPGTEVKRDNTEKFLLACERLHVLLARASERAAVPLDNHVRGVLERILRTEGDTVARAAAWQDAVAARQFPSIEEAIPRYEGETWAASTDEWKARTDPADILEYPAYRFQQAATLHRDHVLRVLLPDAGIALT